MVYNLKIYGYPGYSGYSHPLFLRDVGKYYWNQAIFDQQYKITIRKCTRGRYTSMFRFMGLDNVLLDACRIGDLKIVKQLENQGVDINLKNLPVRKALACGQLEVIQYLNSKGGGTHILGHDRGLALSARAGHLSVVKYLVELGADVQFYNNYAVRHAYKKGHFEVAQFLVDHGAKL
jgi:ankyrin repeat protein